MKRVELLISIAVAYMMLTAAAVWHYGEWGLGGAGLLALAGLSFVNASDVPAKRKPKKKGDS